MQTITVNKPALFAKNALKKIVIQALINRYTVDTNGVIQVVEPVATQKPFAFHLFGEFDRQGGYGIADGLTNVYNTNLLGVYVYGLNTPFFFANPFQNINAKLYKGDIIFMYVDDVTAPNFFTFVVVHARQGGYASLLSQSNITQLDESGWGIFKFANFRMIWNDDEQLSYPFLTIKTRYDGAYQKDTIDPLQFRNSYQRNAVKNIPIQCEFLCNQYIGLSGYLPFENPQLELLFNLYI